MGRLEAVTVQQVAAGQRHPPRRPGAHVKRAEQALAATESAVLKPAGVTVAERETLTGLPGRCVELLEKERP